MYIRIYIYINICKNKTYLLRSFRAMHKKTRFDEILRLQVAYISMLRYGYIYIYIPQQVPYFLNFSSSHIHTYIHKYIYLFTCVHICKYIYTYTYNKKIRTSISASFSKLFLLRIAGDQSLER
jgi:hypothetical protein